MYQNSCVKLLKTIGKTKPTNSLSLPSLGCAGAGCGSRRTPVTQVSSSFAFQLGASSPPGMGHIPHGTAAIRYP